MAAVSSYVKNVAKSFGYAIGDTFRDLNPVVTTLAKETKEVTSDLYQSIKSVAFQKESIDERAFKNQARDIVNATWNNFKDDIKSGKWYNKERKDASEMEMAKAFGFDFDFDFDDNWDFDDPDSDSAQLAMESDNTKEIIGAVDAVGTGIANTVATATVESAGYIVASNNRSSKALYSLNERGFANVTKGIISLNNTFASFAQIMEPLQEHMQNSLNFYTKTTETLNSMNQSIQQLVKNTTPAPLSNASKSYSSKRNKFTDIFSSDTGLSIEAYRDMIKENFGEYKDLTDMAVNALKGLSGGGKNISVMQFATSMFTQAMIPKIFKESMKNFNEELKYFMAGGITKLRNRQGGLVFELLKDFILPKDNFRSQIDPSKYNREAVAWDGTSRKAITEVIPDALMMIYEALTGDSKRYDYSKGKFVSVSSIKKDFEDNRHNYIKSAGGDFRSDALKKVDNNKNLTEAQKAQLNKEIENYFYQAFMTNDGYNVNSRKFDKKQYGVSDEAVAILRQIIEEDRKTGKKRHQKFTYENISQRELYGDYIRSQESAGDIALLHTLNGSEAKRARLGGMGVDKWGNDSLFYLRGIYSFSGFIADNLSFLAGKSEKIDYTGINKRRTFKNKATTGYSDNVAYYKAASAGEKTKEEAYKTTADESAPAETFVNEDDEATKKRNENIKNAKGKAKTTIGKVKDWFRKMFGTGGEKGQLQQWYEKPFNSVALLLDKIGGGLDKLLWGDDETPEKGLFGYLFEKAKKTFGDLFDTLDKKFGLRNAWEKFKSGDFAKETGENLRNVGSSIGNTVKQFFKGGKKQKVPTAAHGRKVTKSGIVAVSEGELIIPSELNPYYHGATHKASQVRNESNIVNRFYGSFAKGGTVGEDDEDGPGLRFIKSGFSELGKGIKAFTDRVFGEKEATKKENEEVNEKVKKILEEAGINKGAMGAGAIIGGGVSLLTGAMINPILGVAAGAAIGLASKSEYVQNLLFGNEKEKGLLPKKMVNFIKESLPSMGKGAAIGGGIGLFAGSPILGAILGSTVGYISSSEKAKNYIFGEMDEDGNRKGGLIPKDLQDLIKKKAPNISAGMIAGLALGPFGIAGNLIAGAGLGFITSSEKFHDWMFDKKNGLATIIHKKVVNNIDNLFHNITNNLLGLGKRIVGSAERRIKNFISNAKRGFEEGKVGFLNTVIGGSVSLGGRAIKGTIGKVGDAIEFANRRVQARNLARGYAVYGEVTDEKGNVIGKRNLTAAERLKLRGDNDNSTSANMDRLISKMNTGEDLTAFQNELRSLKDPDGEYKRAKNSAVTKAYTSLEGANIDRKTIREIGKLVSSGKFDKARKIAESISDTRQREQALNTIAEAESKFGEANTNRNSVAGKLAELKKQGIDLSNPNDIQAYIDRIEDERKLNDKFDKKNQEKAKEDEYKKTFIEIVYDIDKKLAYAFGTEPANVPAWLSVKANTKIEGVKNSVQNLLFGNKDESDVKYELVDGQVMKLRKNSQGEYEPDKQDSGTAEALDKQEEQRNNFATIAKNTGFLAGIGGLFGKLHDKLFGDKDGEKKGFFGKLIESITGDNGLLGSVLQFFTGEKGGVKSLLSKFSFKGILGVALLGLGLGGKFDNLANKLTNGAYGKGGNSDIVEYDKGDGTTGIATKTEDGTIVDENGNAIDEQSVTSVREGDSMSLSERLKKNTVRGFLTGNKGKFSSLASRVLKNAGESSIGKLVKKGVTKLGESSLGKFAKGAAKKAVGAITSGAKKGIKSTVDKATDILLDSNLAEGIINFCKKLKNIPILKNIDVDGLAAKLSKTAAEAASTSAGKKVLKLASNLVVWAKVAFIVVDFTTGYQDAASIMKVSDPTIGQKVIAGLIKAVNGFIPVIGSLIPESILVDVFVEFVAPLLGMDVEEFKKQREESQAELDKYNTENNTNLSWQEYNKQVLENYTWTEKIGNAGKSVWQGTKNTFKSIGNWFTGGGASGLKGQHISQHDSRYKNMKLGSYTVGEKGCGPAVASMIANSYGVNLPMDKAVQMAQKYQDEGGTKSAYFADTLSSNGINTKYLSGNNIQEQVLSKISRGEQVILMGRNAKNVSKDVSPFGPNNHYVIASGIDKNGNIIIRDPESSNIRTYNPNILKSASIGISTSKSAGAAVNYDTDIARKVYGYFTSKGYSPLVTSAIMGNLYGESGMNPAVIQNSGKGPAAGIAQWENYNTKSGRWKGLSDFANSMGYAWSDLDPQLHFIHKELQGLDAFFAGKGKAMSNLTKVGATPTTYAQWLNSTDLDMATRQFEAAFERAGKPHMENRLRAAREYYNLYSGSTYTGNFTAGEPGVAVDANGNSTVSPDGSSSSNGFTSILGAISTAFSKIGNLFGFGSDEENTGAINSSYNGSYSITGNYPSADLPTLSTNATQNFIDIAKSQVGVTEGTGNITEYGEFTGLNGQPWCASFVSWAMNKAYGGDTEKANKALLGGPTGSSSTLYTRFKNQNLFTVDKPMPGDIILYKNDGANAGERPAKHTGIVVGVNGNNVTTVEGNTSSDGKVEDNGGIVWTKNRTIGSSALLGFARPNWGANSSGSVSKPGALSSNRNMMNMTAAGSGLGKSMNSLMRAKFNSGKIQSNVQPNSVVRKSAGASGLSRSAKVTTTTNMLTNLKNNISASSAKIGGSYSRSGAISAEVVEKLLASIIKVLETISNNTSSVDKIYQVLSAYVQSGGSNAKAMAAAKAAETSANNTELDSTIVDLVGTLAQLAKG